MKKYLENDEDVEILHFGQNMMNGYSHLSMNLLPLVFQTILYFSRQTAQICPYRKTDTGLMSKISTMRIQKI